MQIKTEEYDVVVAGGGLAGVCAALASARLGKRTALVQERPVLGGNSSSEVRVTPHGAAAFHHYARETGIISELLENERQRNHQEIFENGWTNSVWDMVLYDACVREKALTLYLNTTVFGVEMSDGRNIESIKARILGAETELILQAGIFIDATGDGSVADAAGCDSMRGSESRDLYGEIHAPVEGRRDDEMGSSLHFRIVDVGRPVEFAPPDWAVKHLNPSYFWESGRRLKDLRGGFWWIEIAKPWDTINDAEAIRHELTRHLFGIWDWMKNHDSQTRDRCRNLALDWIGQVPGKRESRRIVGKYLMTENDIQEHMEFDDEVAFGGWFLDLHTPGGLLAEHSEERSKESYSPYGRKAADSYVGPYAIPHGVMCPEGVDNLYLAGRSLSLTHAAFGTVRVMNTLALMGQAAGVSAARHLDAGGTNCRIGRKDIQVIQQRLMRDGAFLLGRPGRDPKDLSRRARISSSSQYRLTGASPDDCWADGGIAYWQDQIDPRITERLDTVHAQLIPVSGEVRTISLLLSNSSANTVELPVCVRTSNHIWDYRQNTGEVLAADTVQVEPGEAWYELALNLESGGLRFLRVDAGPSPSVLWRLAGSFVPSCVSYFGITDERLRTFGQGATLSFKIDPPQHSYPPSHIQSGWTRPYRDAGCWRSDRMSNSNGEWIRLDWDAPIDLEEIQVTFPGQILREYHAYPPGFRDPQIPKDYVIEGRSSDSESTEWILIVAVENNFQRMRRHLLDSPVLDSPAEYSSIRLRVSSTNGDETVSIYEIRCYGRGAGIWCD